MNEALPGAVIPVLVPLLLGTMLMYAPLFRRQLLMFSVRVPPEWATSVVARGLVRTYRLRVGVLTVVAAALGYWSVATGHNWVFAASPLVLTTGAIVSLLAARRATLPYASHEPLVRSASLDATDPAGSNPLDTGVQFLMLAGAAIWLRTNQEAIPLRFPTHWDLAGNPNGWSQRTVGGVYGPLVIGALVCLLLLVSRLGISLGARRVSGGNNTVRCQTIRMLGRLGYLMSGLFSAISLGPLYPEYMNPNWIAFIVLTGTALLIIPILRTSANSESRVESTPDDAWKMGLFYYNPNDPALMVEKRMGIGYTLNFGHRMSWVLMAGMLAIPLVALVFRNLS